MRQNSPLFAALVCLLFGALAGRANATTIVRLHADRIAFYNDRYLIEANGHVRVTTSDGMTITGDTFSMDLKLNRFLIASNVHLRSKGGNIDGAALADFLDFNRVYFVPVIAKPDRWTYLNGDFRHPLKGREMPGDVFYFPDLTHSQVSLRAYAVTIGAKSFVRFTGVTLYPFHVGVPLPSYYVYFGADQDLGQNSLAGANFDLTWNAAGNANSISALHIRKDQTNGVYASFEQHIAGPHGYAVASINPGTKQQHFWTLVGDRRIGKRFQLNSFSQLYQDTPNGFFRQPFAASTWTYVTATQALPQSFLQATAQFTNYALINDQPSIKNHPFQLHLTATTFSHRIGRTPLYENLSYGVGVNHDAFGLQSYGGYIYTTLWDHTFAGNLYLPSFKFGNRYNPYKTYYFNASFNKTYTWYSLPHYTVSTTTVGSVSRQFSREINAYTSYSVANTGDFYRQGGYVPPLNPPVIGGVPVYSILAFRGVSTLRTFTTGINYSASPNLVASVTYQHHQDFPLPYPGLFTLPPLNNLGEEQYSNYLGQPPNNITGDVRFLALPHVVLDVSREYFFNFGTLRWSPQFNVQVIGE